MEIGDCEMMCNTGTGVDVEGRVGRGGRPEGRQLLLLEELLTPGSGAPHASAISFSQQMYAPQSRARARILLLLLDTGGSPLHISSFYDALPECSRWCVRKALSWLWQRGVLRRIGRGFYALESTYLQFLSELRSALERLVFTKASNNSSSSNRADNVSKVTGRHRPSPGVTKLNNTELAEKIKQYVKQRYGDELDETDMLVVETLAKKYEETGSWYIEDNEGSGLAEQLREWARRLRLCDGSGSIGRGGAGGGCPSLSEVAYSLRRLADMGIVYVNKRYRKMRLNRRLVERATGGEHP